MSCHQTTFCNQFGVHLSFQLCCQFPLLHFHTYLIILVLLMAALTGLQAQLERMGLRSESGHYRSLPPVTVSVRPFFLESMKLAPFLTGSNTPREEVIATSCFDSLVCGKAKTEERRGIAGGVALQPAHMEMRTASFCVSRCQKRWERFPISCPAVARSSCAGSPVFCCSIRPLHCRQ